jgi:serine/threonine protein kinase
MLIRLLIFSTLVLAVNLVAGIFAKDQTDRDFSPKNQHHFYAEGERPRFSALLRGSNRNIFSLETQRDLVNLLTKPKITKRFAKEEWKAELGGQNNLTRLPYRRRLHLRDEAQRTEAQKWIRSTRRMYQSHKPVEGNEETLVAEESSQGLPAVTKTRATITGLNSTSNKEKTSEELAGEDNVATENNNINLDVRDKIDNGTLATNGTSSDKGVTDEHTDTSAVLLKTNITTVAESPESQSVSTSHRKRRPPTVIRSETQASPLPVAAALTMSESLYNHFRPLDKEVPEDHLLPFLDFGKKLVPVNAKTTSPVASTSSTSSTNTIEGISTSPRTPTIGQNNLLSTTPLKVTSSNTRTVHFPREDEIHEDMDVSVVKSVVEENKVSRSRGDSLQFLRHLGGLYRKHEISVHEVLGNLSSVNIAPASSTEKNGLKTEQATKYYSDFDESSRNELESVQNISTTFSTTERSSTSNGIQTNTDANTRATTEKSVISPIKNDTNLSSNRPTAETSTNGTPNRSAQVSDISKPLAQSSTSQWAIPTQLSAFSGRIEATVAAPYLRGRSPLTLRNTTSIALLNRRSPSALLNPHRHSNALSKLSKLLDNTSKPSENISVYNVSTLSPVKQINFENISVSSNLDEKHAVTTLSTIPLQTQPDPPSIRTGRKESVDVTTQQFSVSKLNSDGEEFIVKRKEPIAERHFTTQMNASFLKETVQNVGSNISSQLSVENVNAALITSTSPETSQTNATLPTEIPFVTSSVQSPTTKILSTAVVTSVSVKGAWPVMITETPPLEPTLLPPDSHRSQNTQKEPIEYVLESPGPYDINRSHFSIKEPATNKAHHATISAHNSLPRQIPSNNGATNTSSGVQYTSTDIQKERDVISNHSKVTTLNKNITSNSTKNIGHIATEYGQNNTMTISVNKTRSIQFPRLRSSSTERGEMATGSVTEADGLAEKNTDSTLVKTRGHDSRSRVGTPKLTTPNIVGHNLRNTFDPPTVAPETVRTKNLTRQLPEYVTRQEDIHSTSSPVTIKPPVPDADFDFPLLKLYNTSTVWVAPARATTKPSEELHKSSTEYPPTGNGSTTVTNKADIMEPSTPNVIVVTKGTESVSNTSGVYKGESRNGATGQVGNEETKPNTDVDVRNDSNSGVNLLLGVGNGSSRNNVTVGNTPPGESVSRKQGISVVVYVLSALGIVPVAIGIGFVARYCVQRRRKLLDDTDAYSDISSRKGGRSAGHTGSDIGSPVSGTKLPRVQTHLNWDHEKTLPAVVPVPNTRWEFPRSKLRLQTVLGQGNFGQVLKAEADDISGHEGTTRLVAVKTVKEGASSREKEDLLRELEIMQQLGSHANVVTLLGCCTEKEPYLLIMEYVMYGKLLAFLRDHRTRQHYYNFSEDSDALTSRDLTIFAYCVSRGMEYLGSKGIIHRDLAARNVLVDHNKMCKIADFGMSRSVRETGDMYEQRHTKGALPIRWMAPESLHYRIFTHRSDVWSFGILMWEIVTLGSTPYPTMGAREVMRRVWDGYRLERPSHCRTELFRVISKCWNADPNKRPDFAALRHDIGALIEASTDGGGYVDLESFAESNKYSYGRSEDHSTLPYHHHHQHHLQSTSAGLGSRITGDDETVTM